MKDDIEDGNFCGVKYLDPWDFEDEYSHNHINENREKFIELANDYFKNENLPFVMMEICDSAMVCDENGNILCEK